MVKLFPERSMPTLSSFEFHMALGCVFLKHLRSAVTGLHQQHHRLCITVGMQEGLRVWEEL